MKSLFPSRDQQNDELREEMESHILQKAEALEAEGMSPSAALREARRTFGNQARLQDLSYQVRSNRFIDAMFTDLHFALAQLRRSPMYTSAAVLILCIGIGANTAVFNILYQAVFRTLPVRDPAKLALIYLRGDRVPGPGAALTLKMFDELRSRQRAFEDLSAWLMQDRVTFEDGSGQPRSLSATLVSGNAFELLGLTAQTGRLLTPDDDRDPHPASWPVVLSDSFWRERYHRDPRVVGQTSTISGQSIRIVGIAPAGFEGITPNLPPQLFLPLRFFNAQKIGGTTDLLGQPNAFNITVLGRLRDDASLHVANQELRTYTDAIVTPNTEPVLRKFPFLAGVFLNASDGSRGRRVLDQYRSTLTLLQLLMGAGLLFCCANVSVLQLARRVERAHEFAVRVALGASRSHLVRQSLAESSLIALCGAALAVPTTFAVSHLLGYFLTAPGAGDVTSVHPDWTVLAIAGGFALLCAISVAVAPVYFAHRANPADVLSSRLNAKRFSLNNSRLLLTAQVTATFLLVAAGCFYFRSLHSLYMQDLGYDPRHVTEVTAQFQQLQQSPDEIMGIYRRMRHALNGQQEIEAATYTWITQLTTVTTALDVTEPSKDRLTRLSYNAVGPGYFSTLRTPVLQGREFTDDDTSSAHCILNDLAANSIFPMNPRDVLGRSLQLRYEDADDADTSSNVCQVIGVVQATKFADVHAPKEPILFVPVTTAFMHLGGFHTNMVFLLRGDHEEAKDAAYLRVLSKIAPGTGYERFLPMERQFDDALGSERLLSYLTLFFGIVAFLLCGIAASTLLKMRLQQNMPQIAIRIALGASPWNASGVLIREMLAINLVSVCVGACALHALSSGMHRLVHVDRNVSGWDYLAAAGLITVMMLCAGALPAIRAGTLQPMRVLSRDA